MHGWLSGLQLARRFLTGEKQQVIHSCNHLLLQTHLSPEGQVCTDGTHIHMIVTDALLQDELNVLRAGVAPIILDSFVHY